MSFHVVLSGDRAAYCHGKEDVFTFPFLSSQSPHKGALTLLSKPAALSLANMEGVSEKVKI